MPDPQFPQQPQQPYPPQPQQQGYPQQQYGPPQTPPIKKGMPIWGWLLIGVVVFAFLAVVGISVITYLFVKKAEQVVKNPLSAIVQMAALANPDLDVLDVNEKTGKVTVRDKKTGKTVTIDGDAIKDGKISIDTDDGHAVIGAGADVKTPDWIFLPGGAKIISGMTADSSSGAGGVIVFNTQESLASAKSFFEDKYKSAGYEESVSSMSAPGGDQALHLVFQHSGRKRTVTIGVAKTDEGASGSITYGEGQK